jgi:acyl-CoA thioester hydrolase
MGVAYYGSYLAFFETGRVEAMRQIGSDYASVVRRGVHLPVVEATVKYHRPAAFDDLLLIRVEAEDVRGARFSFVYEVTREADGALIASGRTIHACVDAQTLRPMRLPDWLRADLARL